MSLVIPERFQHILCVLIANTDEQHKIALTITGIKDLGSHYTRVVLNKADIDMTKRASELKYMVDCVITIMQNP